MLTLATFADLKKLLDLDKNALTDYPALELLVESVYEAMESYCGRTFQLDKYTETCHIWDQEYVSLKALPITSIVSVTLVSGTVSTDLTSLVTIRDYDILLGIEASGTITTVYKGGYDEAPGPLRRAHLLQVAYEYQNKDHIGAESVSNEGGAVTRPALQLIPEVKKILNRYRHVGELV